MLTVVVDTPAAYTTALAAHPHVLVDYYKDNCPGCRMLEMALNQFSATPLAESVTLLKVKMETVGEEFFRGLGLRQTPTLALFKDGQEIQRLPGYQTPAQIAQAVRESLGSTSTFEVAAVTS